ncbi:MAG: radical SAM family heme chaperone HemW [Myxococcales bacterium]|nr:radical SAM family heme chaperone HemW [Myxococcales bacterium]
MPSATPARDAPGREHATAFPHDASVAVYVHLPFCATRCGYCDFATTATARIPYDAYTQALGAEWQHVQAHMVGRVGGSLYLGGGTPSLWPSAHLAALLSLLPLHRDAFSEVTLEANPRDGDAAWYRDIARLGINRISIGVQAMSDARLRWLGRTHTAAQARQSVHWARQAGIENISVDFIYATPQQTLAEIETELRALLALQPAHISAYELSLSPQSPLGQRALASLPDDAARADMWWRVRHCLESAGYAGYEVSNYALPGRQSRHNQHYWRGGRYVGLGAGAHGHLVTASGRFRYENIPTPSAYIARAGKGAPDEDQGGAWRHIDVLEDAALARELVMLGLRTTQGVDLRVLAALAHALLRDWQPVFARWCQQGLAQMTPTHLCPTPQGMLWADSLALACF